MMEEKRLSDGPMMMIVTGRVLNDENMSETLRSNPDHSSLFLLVKLFL